MSDREGLKKGKEDSVAINSEQDGVVFCCN